MELHDRDYLQDVLILLVALIAFVPIFQRLRIGVVLAYLAAGIVIGPSLLGLFAGGEETNTLAELGVVFLLFAVGLEVSNERLRLFGVRSFLLAGLQVFVTTVVIAACGLALGFSPAAALVVGGALTFSSSAVVFQILSERGQMTGQFARSVIAVLLIQDLMVAPMIVVAAAIGSANESVAVPLAMAALKFGLVLVAVVLCERTILRPLLRFAAETGAPEVFTGLTLLLVLGIGWLTEEAGLSMALGAFLAGKMVADTEYRHQVAADIQPFRGLLLGLFFMTVGMTLDLRFAAENAGKVVTLVVALMALKAAILFALALAFSIPRLRALALAALLSQGSEFAFVLLTLAFQRNLLDSDARQVLTIVVGLSMALTPLGAMMVSRYGPKAREVSLLGDLDREGGEASNHVVIAGFGQVGMAVARYLAGEHVPVLILDLSPRRVRASRARNLPVFYGNAGRTDVLRAAHLDRAHALVVAVPEAATAEQITMVARRAAPTLKIYVRAPDEDWIARMRAAGANAVVIDGLTTALELAERVMLIYAPESPAAA
ncbi:MAG TPA: cation:proton antiporter [Rhodospirillales bacterium]|nr:cation:proton antiporter [Rhodospirillales bacterium]